MVPSNLFNLSSLQKLLSHSVCAVSCTTALYHFTSAFHVNSWWPFLQGGVTMATSVYSDVMCIPSIHAVSGSETRPATQTPPSQRVISERKPWEVSYFRFLSVSRKDNAFVWWWGLSWCYLEHSALSKQQKCWTQHKWNVHISLLAFIKSTDQKLQCLSHSKIW